MEPQKQPWKNINPASNRRHRQTNRQTGLRAIRTYGRRNQNRRGARKGKYGN